MSDDSYIRNVIEAALLAAGRPLQVSELAGLFEERGRPANAAIRAALERLDAEYAERGIEVKETASGFRIQVRTSLAVEVSRLWPERPPRYSRALLETLALIAYRQPITRAEIEAVRGVAVNPAIVKTVIERNWVRVVSHKEVPGRPEMLGTTNEFLDYFGLKKLEDLPPLAELKMMGEAPPVQLELPQAPAAPAGRTGSDGDAQASADALALAEAVLAEVEAGRAGIEVARTADASGDPPSPFVEPVMDGPTPQDRVESEPLPKRETARRESAAKRRRSTEADPAQEEDAADEERPAADGKAGMAAGPRDLDN